MTMTGPGDDLRLLLVEGFDGPLWGASTRFQEPELGKKIKAANNKMIRCAFCEGNSKAVKEWNIFTL